MFDDSILKTFQNYEQYSAVKHWLADEIITEQLFSTKLEAVYQIVFVCHQFFLLSIVFPFLFLSPLPFSIALITLFVA